MENLGHKEGCHSPGWEKLDQLIRYTHRCYSVRQQRILRYQWPCLDQYRRPTSLVFYHLHDDNLRHDDDQKGHDKLGWHWTYQRSVRHKFLPSVQNVGGCDRIQALTAVRIGTFVGPQGPLSQLEKTRE